MKVMKILEKFAIHAISKLEYEKHYIFLSK